MVTTVSHLPMKEIIRVFRDVAEQEDLPNFTSERVAVRRLRDELNRTGRRLTTIRGRAEVLPPNASQLLGREVRVLAPENPKRPGSRTFKRFELYSQCATSDEYLRLCQERGLGSRREVLSDLAWDSQHRFIALK